MTFDVQTGTYEFDPLGTNSDNQIVAEQHSVTPPDDPSDSYFFIPYAAPFFAHTVILRRQGNPTPLVLGTDFNIGHVFSEASKATGKKIAGSIVITNRSITGIVEITYNTIGGEWGHDGAAIVDELSNLQLNPILRSWGQINTIPNAFPVVPHDQNLDNFVGTDQVVAAIASIADTIAQTQGNVGVNHLSDFTNPHNTDKADVGLGNVDNFATASPAEAVAGVSTSRFITPRGVSDLVNAITAAAQAHASAVGNPHGMTKADIGLPAVQNYPIATLIQAQEGIVGTAYMTPELTARAIQAQVPSDVSGHISNFNNPHNTDKADVGLSNVQNFPTASLEEAQIGSRGDRYMTPARTRQAIETIASSALSHVTRTNNPHGTTKTHVGLGNVSDYPIATLSQAQEGIVDTAYMTPKLVKDAIDSQVRSTIVAHISQTNNPHNTDKADVGLGNVQNFATANETQAIAGTSTSLYMTPATTAAVVSSLTSTAVAHAGLTGNPHGMTKADIGLGNTPNAPFASQQEALGNLDNVIMSPLRTTQLISATLGAVLQEHTSRTGTAAHGLGTISTRNVGTGSSDFRSNAENDSRFLRRNSNLTDLINTAAARTALGLGSMASQTGGTAGNQYRNNDQNDLRFMRGATHGGGAIYITPTIPNLNSGSNGDIWFVEES